MNIVQNLKYFFNFTLETQKYYFNTKKGFKKWTSKY